MNNILLTLVLICLVACSSSPTMEEYRVEYFYTPDREHGVRVSNKGGSACIISSGDTDVSLTKNGKTVRFFIQKRIIFRKAE